MVELFLKECKQIGKSLVYFIFIGVVTAFYFSQFFAEIPSGRSKEPYDPRKVIEEPIYVEKAEDYFYGSVYEEIPEQIIPKAATRLYREYIEGSYVAYPMGFYKTVKLNEKETKRIEEIINEVTGKSVDVLREMDIDGKWNEVYESISIGYGRFKELMEEVNDIIGSGSNYSKDNLIRLGERPRTYEEAMKAYKELLQEDKITNAYARLFSDYLGIVLGLFPIFVVVFFMMRDRKSNMHELIYSRGVSSAKLVICRYTALVLMMMLPVLLLAVLSTIKFIGIGKELNVAIDYFAYIKYSLGWLMPTVMAVTAVGMFFTLMTDSIVTIFLQLVWFFSVMFSGGLAGNYGIKQLIIRFNTAGEREFFITNLNNILMNRLFYIALSVVFVAASVYILNLKREGCINFYDKLRKYSSALSGKSKNSLPQ
jgi:hypothetical protein